MNSAGKSRIAVFTKYQDFRQKLVELVKSINAVEALLLSVGVLLALLLRYTLRGIQTSDFDYFFNDWYSKIQAGGIKSIGENISNYPPVYLYLLYLVSVIFPTIWKSTAVKIPSVVADLICAWYVFRIVRLKISKGPAASLAALIFLFAPTVVLNGAAWGQIESIYTAALLACLYYLLRKKNWLACIAFGIAFSIKLQSIYLAPLLLALWLRKELSFKHLLAIPAVYLVSILPAWIAGRPILELLTIYTSQVSGYEGLVHNATSLYTWLPNADFNTWYVPGLILAGAICLMYIYSILKGRVESLAPYLITLALASLLIVPFFLPKTHDRYFFPAEAVSIIFGFYYPQFFFVPILINLTSFFIYQPYLFNVDVFPQPILTLAMFVAIIIVLWQMIVQLYPIDHTPEEK